MPKRSRTSTKPAKRTSKSRQPKSDPNRAAFDVLQQIINKGDADGKNPLAVALGRLGGLKGGKARAAKLTPEQRRESARRAAMAKWDLLRRDKSST
jgi:hypothetical protein